MKQPALRRFHQWVSSPGFRNILYDLAAPITANISLLPFLFVESVRQWVGRRAILIFVLMHLAFYPGNNTVGAHLELVFLGLLYASAWSAITFLITCCQVWIDDGNPIFTSAKTRGLGAAYIFVSFFFSSIIWSCIPRLRPAMRVGMFTQTWAVTGSAPAITSRNFTDIFFPLLISAVVSACSNLLFPRTAHGIYFRTLSAALKTVCQSVDTVMDDFQQGLQNWLTVSRHQALETTTLDFLQQSTKFLDFQQLLEKQVRAIRGAVAAAQHEISWCRVHVSETAQFTTYLSHVLTWMKSGFGMSLPNVEFERQLFDATEADVDGVPGSGTFPSRSPEATGTPEDWSYEHTDIYEAKMSLVSLEESLRDSINMLLVMVNLIVGSTPAPNREAGKQFARMLISDTIIAEKRENTWLFVKNMLNKLDNAMEESHAGLQRLLHNRGFREFLSPFCGGESGHLATPLPSAVITPDEHAEPAEGFREPCLFTPEMYVLAQFSLSMLQLAQQTKDVWQHSKDTLILFLERRKYSLHFPRINFWHWINSSSGIGLFHASLLTDTFIPSLLLQHLRYGDDDGSGDSDDGMSEPPDVSANIFEDNNPHSHYKYYITNMTKASSQTHRKDTGTWLERRIWGFVAFISRSPSVLKTRVWLSIWLQKLKKSHHIHFALKLASGVTLFCTIAFLQPSPNDWWVSENGQWLIISYIWCLEASTGDSVRISICRLIGTILGAVCGLIAFEISRKNVYALSVLVVCFEIPASLLRLRFKYPPIGSVMGLTTPIVAITPYVQSDWTSASHVALVRGYMIILGILAALVVNVVFWPYHARSRLIRKLAHTTTLLQGLYVNMSRQMFYGNIHPSTETTMSFQRLETDIRRQLTQCDALKSVMTSEISLVPKPVAIMDRIYQRLQMIFVLFVVLRASRETHQMQVYNETISHVLPQRQELVSTIMLDLWMIGQSMNTRSRMPQFAPSTRRAVDELNAAIALSYHEVLGDDKMLVSRQKRLYDGPEVRQRIATGFSVHANSALRKNSRTYTGTLFVLAEHCILSQVALSLEALLHLLRYMLGELRFVY